MFTAFSYMGQYYFDPLPNEVTSSSWFYSATEGNLTDASGNGNNGTVEIVGDGVGTGNVIFIPDSAPFFRLIQTGTSKESNRGIITTGYNLKAISMTGSFSLNVIYRKRKANVILTEAYDASNGIRLLDAPNTYEFRTRDSGSQNNSFFEQQPPQMVYQMVTIRQTSTARQGFKNGEFTNNLNRSGWSSAPNEMVIGYNFAEFDGGSTNFDLVSAGYWEDIALSNTEISNLYNYYKPIYDLP